MKIPRIQLWRVKPLLRSPDAYIAATNTVRYLEGKNRILIVGDAGGRDWRNLQREGKDIYQIDLSPQADFPNLYVQSIEQKTPFEDGFFDGVVMNEVLEHLFRDLDALEEVHRILKADGMLVVTVPYMSNIQDAPEWHVRIHSPLTIRRLLQRSGFEIEEHFCRGFCSRLTQMGLIPAGIVYLAQKLVEIVTHKSPDESVSIVNGVLDKLERFLGTHTVTIEFQKLFPSYGGMLRARRSSRKKDFDEVQRTAFSYSDTYKDTTASCSSKLDE